ncbi:MAG: LysM peptidoglycan-binding domain-containing protein, partial [Bdellovibrionota bacterium]
GTRSAQRYRIQRGDTHWDISQTLFGDGKYWPKIWSLNSSITNPHLIRPNNVIRFILGDESGPPAFTVTEGEEESSTTTTITQNDEGPEIPPPSRRYNPVVKKLPPSLPAYQDPSAMGSGIYDEAGIEYGRRKIIDLVDQVPLSAYIDDTKPKPLGVVSEVETGFNLASSLQYVYVRMNRGEGEVGATYLSVMDRGAIKVDADVVKQRNLGFGIEVLGEVQLLEKVNSEKKNQNDGDVYRALVTKTVSPVSVGSALIPAQIEQVNLSEKGSRSQIVAQIIGGQFSNERKLYGPQSFAFLNKGENDGLAVGQVLPIRLNRKARDQSSQVLANVRAIGWLKIVKTTPKFATAVILRAWEGIATGDFTGAGEMDMSQSGMEDLDNTQTAKGSLMDELDDGGSVEDPIGGTEENSEEGDDLDDGADFTDDGTTFEE